MSRLALVLLALALGAAPSPPAAAAPRFRVLVFTKTAGYRHDAIATAVAALHTLGRANGFDVVRSEDARSFSDGRLRRFRVVVFLLTSGDVLDSGERAAFVRFVRAGGGFVGVHSALDTEHHFAWYRQLEGAEFRAHAPIQRAAIVVEDRTHPATRHLRRRFPDVDEWYAFVRNPRRHVHVLLTVDERSYAPGAAAMGRDHPISWCHRFQGGRAFATALGHTRAAYRTPFFRRHLVGAIRWAAGVAPGRC